MSLAVTAAVIVDAAGGQMASSTCYTNEGNQC
jgi:hypothetical protein